MAGAGQPWYMPLTWPVGHVLSALSKKGTASGDVAQLSATADLDLIGHLTSFAAATRSFCLACACIYWIHGGDDGAPVPRAQRRMPFRSRIRSAQTAKELQKGECLHDGSLPLDVGYDADGADVEMLIIPPPSPFPLLLAALCTQSTPTILSRHTTYPNDYLHARHPWPRPLFSLPDHESPSKRALRGRGSGENW